MFLTRLEHGRLQDASARRRADRLGKILGRTLILPSSKAGEVRQFGGILHPFDGLRHGDEVGFGKFFQDLIDPVEKSLEHLWATNEPGSVHVDAKGSAVGFVMPLEVD